MATIRAHINPEMLTWARTRARFDLDSASARVGVKPERYAAWEEGTKKPTLKQLRKIGKVFGRPPALFYLDSPPDEPEILKEMRRLPSVADGPESPALALQVRLAVERRDVALSLHEQLGEHPREIGLTLSLSDDPERAASAVRDVLGVGVGEQMIWSERGAALRNWRLAFERAGVLVFQVPGVPMKEMRGFAIAERPLPVIAYNSKDSDAGRIFTLFHEFGHVLLGSTSLDTQSSLVSGDHWQVERFCNHLAAASLVPQSELIKSASGHGPNGLWSEGEVLRLARRFGVSASVLVRRLDRFGLIASGVYDALREHFDHFTPSASGDDAEGGNVYRNRIVHVGRYLTELAFRSYAEDRMTATDLSALVNLQVKLLDSLADKMAEGGSATRVGA